MVKVAAALLVETVPLLATHRNCRPLSAGRRPDTVRVAVPVPLNGPPSDRLVQVDPPFDDTCQRYVGGGVDAARTLTDPLDPTAMKKFDGWMMNTGVVATVIVAVAESTLPEAFDTRTQ